MKAINKAIAVMLALILISSSFVCFAVDGEKQYYNYDKVMLLGDSEASGFTDYGDEFSEFTRVDDSYAAYISDYFNAEFYPYACPGFRTIELRCMLDDNYKPVDKYLFKKVPHTREDEIMAKAPALRQAIADTDMIIIGIGGNDWGAYLGWVMADEQLEHPLPEDFKKALREFLENSTIEDATIDQIMEIANYFGAFKEVNAALPEAAIYAFSNLWENWNYLVEYIYENNPDVTLVVVGMFPTYYKTEKGAPDIVSEPDPIAKAFEDAMISLGNKHMIENQDKYGYIYVDTYGTTVETCHPTVAGHRFIADRILEELPNARFQYTDDVTIRTLNYKAIEYMAVNGIMEGTSDTTFSPDDNLTKDVLSKALNKITGDYKITDKTGNVSKLYLASTLFNSIEKNSIASFINAIKFTFNVLTSGDSKITRAEGAGILYSYVQTF